MNVVTISPLVKKIIDTNPFCSDLFESKGKFYTFLNPVSYLEAQKNKDLYSNFDGIFVDGKFLAIAIKILYHKKITRCSFDTTSIAPELFTYAEKNNKTLYIIAGKLTIKGALYVGGKIYGPDGSEITGSGGNIEYIIRMSTNASNKRSEKPEMDYAPGLYEYGVKDDPTVSNPSSYRDCTPNDMYKEGTINNLANPELAKAAKYIQDKFKFALAHGTDTPYTNSSGGTAYPSDIVTVNYSQRGAKYGAGVNISKSCKLSLQEVNPSCVAGNTPAKFTVHVTNEDIVILLPMTGTSTQMGAKIRVDNSAKTGDYFVYFMFYDPNNSNEETTNYYTKTAAQNASKTIIFSPGPNAKGGAQVSDTMFCDMNSNTITNYGSTNIFYMLPDGMNMNLGANGIHSILQGVVYGPKSKVNFTEPANPGDYSGVYGQIKVESYYVAQNHNIQNIFNCPPANDSILGFIAAKQPSSGNLKFKYYVKHT